MKKVIVFNWLSMDGLFAGPNGETHEWMVHDNDVDKESHKMMNPDTILLGRVTYQLFESYWPKVAEDPNAPKEARKIADELNEMKKVVFSRTLKDVKWVNTKLVSGDLAEEVRKLKRGNGSDMVIFGSGSLVEQLTYEGLIDEYLFTMTPVILGEGNSCFKHVKKLNLKLLTAKNFDSGNVLLHYEAGKEENGNSKNRERERAADLTAG